MGIEKTHGRNYDLARLLRAMDNGLIVLPEFQRDFLWDTTAVKQLLATCLNGWPIGSLLLLPGRSHLFFKTRGFESAGPPATPPELVVLDGQQRLTSLYQALRGTGDIIYGIKYKMLESEQTIEQLEDAIFSLSRPRWYKKYPSPADEYRDEVIPVRALADASSFYSWRDEAVEAENAHARTDIANLYVMLLSGLDRYEVPAVVIDDDVHPEAVARIFERVNRLGQPLSTFDLVVAKSFAEGFNLREKWDAAQTQFPRLARFLNGDGLPILSVIALHVRESVRQNDILALSGGAVRDYWEKAVAAVDDAISFLEVETYVWTADWLPYRVYLPILGALSLNNALRPNTELIGAWFWETVTSGRFDVASNTKAKEDFLKLLDGSLQLPESIGIDADTFAVANRRQYGALHRGILCLMASADPLDLVQANAPIRNILKSGDESPSTISLLPEDEEFRGIRADLLTLGSALTTSSVARIQPHFDFKQLSEAQRDSQLLPYPIEPLDINQFMNARIELLAKQLSRVSNRGIYIYKSSEDETEQG